ncbi:MAG: CRTAC1 family protein [Gammaproteobacteria bacterium]|jgi:hypothetical protein
MTRNSSNRQQPGSGESAVRKAIYRSLSTVLILVLIGAGIYWYRGDERVPEEAVTDTTLTGPAAEVGHTPPQEPPAPGFTEISHEAGIDFVHTSGAYGEKLLPETMGSGVAFLDYDNDADQDLLLVNSNWFPGHEQGAGPTLALYENDGTGRFREVTRQAGLAVSLYGMGAAVGDYDNDGWTDVYITALGENRLFRNREGHFVDVTSDSATAGLESDFSTAAAFFDYDNDGDLDLYVGNYVVWSREIDMEIDFRLTGLGRAIGAPNHYYGTNSRLYRNDGDGKFSDVSHSAGISVNEPATDAPEGKALGVVPFDYDRDGWIDLFVANDTVRNFLYHNLGNGHFEEVGALEGIAYDRNGKATGAMGIDAAYIRNDDDIGVSIGNFANEMSSLFVTTDGKPPFSDAAVLEGFGPDSRLPLTFGLFYFDYDLDGRLDLFLANGHLESEINLVQPSQFYAQPAQLFWNCGEICRTRFVQVEDTGDLRTPMVGRGAAYADIDNDGDQDIVVTQNGRRTMLFRNDQQTGHHWLRVKPVGRNANRSAIGAIIELRAAGTTQRRGVIPARSYLSQVELPVTFGLGTAKAIDSLVITWPGGQTQNVPVDRLDSTITVVQAEQG